MAIFVETERLYLRELEISDAEAMFEIDSAPEVHRYLGTKPLLHLSQVHEIIRNIRQQYELHGVGRWAVMHKQSNQFMGWSGLKMVTDTVNNHRQFYDLGFRFNQKYWGKGFATEAANAAIIYAFNTLKTEQVFATVHHAHIASQQVLRKVGMQLIESFADDEDLCYWYGISKNRWNMLNLPG